jgi:ATP-dependent Lhr-like helicase
VADGFLDTVVHCAFGFADRSIGTAVTDQPCVEIWGMNTESPGNFNDANALPRQFSDWFARRGWQARPHQLEMLQAVQAGQSALLISPTGGGKTLAGFLPSLIDLAAGAGQGLNTLYVSPLKALAVDIARNLEAPIAEMGLDIKVETRTGDTPAAKRRRQLSHPPDILITTPEQIALMIAYGDMDRFFAGLRHIIIDELHALVANKRGVLLSLGLARLTKLAPDARRVGLSATVAEPDKLAEWLMPQRGEPAARAQLIFGKPGAPPDISIMRTEERVPWSGHSSRYAIGDIYRAIGDSQLSLIFVNTRSQAEIIFQELWAANDDGLPIALHHGSLDVSQRRKVETAMAAGRLRAVVCTSTLDLGIDWGDVDLVINVGAPKGSSRILQRIGRANHRLDEPSKAVLVPANRFEVLECEAARAAAVNGDQDSEPPLELKRDVLAQHILGTACAAPFSPDELYAEVTAAWPYRYLSRESFDKAIDFVSTGGYALRSYEQYAKLKPDHEGKLRLAHPRIAQAYRMNVGTIVEAEMLQVRLISQRRPRARPVGAHSGKKLGEIEEWFIDQLVPRDTFIFAGQILRFEGLEEHSALVSRAAASEPRIPSYQGGKFPLSTYLASRVRAMLADPDSWRTLPDQVRDWLSVQRWKSVLPRADQMLVETFPRANKHYMVCYPFAGRLAHQTLGMLLTRRLERMRARPLGFVANDYALSVWGLGDLSLGISSGRLDLAALFDEDMLGDDLDAWLIESSLMKRTFRTCAIIAGLIERRWPGKEKTGRQMTVSSDLIYDVLRAHEPDHYLLKAAWDDAAAGLIDVHRLAELLERIKGRIIHRALDEVSPLAVPVMLEIGREPIYGEADDALLAEAADQLVDDAMRML